MEFREPIVVYTAEKNIEAHMIVEMLDANGIEAFADEDQSGVSLWALGTIGQFHRPQVWVDQSNAVRATELVKDFEQKKKQRLHPQISSEVVDATCEECQKTSSFSAALNGTVQSCPVCGHYLDVGEFEFDSNASESAEDE